MTLTPRLLKFYHRNTICTLNTWHFPSWNTSFLTNAWHFLSLVSCTVPGPPHNFLPRAVHDISVLALMESHCGSELFTIFSNLVLDDHMQHRRLHALHALNACPAPFYWGCTFTLAFLLLHMYLHKPLLSLIFCLGRFRCVCAVVFLNAPRQVHIAGQYPIAAIIH